MTQDTSRMTDKEALEYTRSDQNLDDIAWRGDEKCRVVFHGGSRDGEVHEAWPKSLFGHPDKWLDHRGDSWDVYAISPGEEQIDLYSLGNVGPAYTKVAVQDANALYCEWCKR